MAAPMQQVVSAQPGARFDNDQILPNSKAQLPLSAAQLAACNPGSVVSASGLAETELMSDPSLPGNERGEMHFTSSVEPDNP